MHFKVIWYCVSRLVLLVIRCILLTSSILSHLNFMLSRYGYKYYIYIHTYTHTHTHTYCSPWDSRVFFSYVCSSQNPIGKWRINAWWMMKWGITRLPMITFMTHDKPLILDDFIEEIKYLGLNDAEYLHTWRLQRGVSGWVRLWWEKSELEKKTQRRPISQ